MVLFPLALIWLIVIVVWAIRSRPSDPAKPTGERTWRRRPRGPRQGPERGPAGGAATRPARTPVHPVNAVARRDRPSV